MIIFLNVDGAMHFIYSHKYNTNSAKIHLIWTEYYSEHNVYVFALAWGLNPNRMSESPSR